MLIKNEDNEIKSELPGSDSGYRKKGGFYLLREKILLKKKREFFYKLVVLRQIISDFERMKEFVVMNNEIMKEVRCI